MTVSAVDTNVLLALLHDDEHADAAERALRRAYRQGRLVATPVVYTEIDADRGFATSEAVGGFFDEFSIDIVTPSREARFSAGEASRTSTDRRPDGLQCPTGGTTHTPSCPECGDDATPRQHVPADFLIGGHAAVDADELVSFDRATFESYFPSLSFRP